MLAAIWGCSFWWIKLGLRACSPVDVAFARVGLGATALLVISAATGVRLPRRPRAWGHLFVVAVLLNSVPFTLFAYGETHVSAVLAGLINGVTPVGTLLAVLVVFRDQRPTPVVMTGMAIGLVGVLVVVGVWQGLGGGRLLGIAACLGAVLCYGLSFPYSRHYLTGREEGPVALATGQVLCGTAQLLPFAVVFGHVHAHPPATSLLALAGLGVLGSGVAYVLNFRVITAASATIASTVTYLIPVVAVAVGAVFLGEPVTWYEIVGGALVLLGAAVAQGLVRARRRTPAVALRARRT